MRYLIPALLAAFLVTGCAGQQCTHEQPEQPAPLLADIPVLGKEFETAPQPEKAEPTSAEVSDAIPLLASIPILGELFKRADEKDSDD